jgi:hypothetical protein
MTEEPLLQGRPAVAGRPGGGEQEGHRRDDRKKDSERAQDNEQDGQHPPQQSFNAGRQHQAEAQAPEFFSKGHGRS